MKGHICPVCGFANLAAGLHDNAGCASFEVCLPAEQSLAMMTPRNRTQNYADSGWPLAQLGGVMTLHLHRPGTQMSSYRRRGWTHKPISHRVVGVNAVYNYPVRLAIKPLFVQGGSLPVCPLYIHVKALSARNSSCERGCCTGWPADTHLTIRIQRHISRLPDRRANNSLV